MAAALNYRAKGSAYRVADEAMKQGAWGREADRVHWPCRERVVSRFEPLLPLRQPLPRTPRYHMQYAYLSVCRTDFGDISRKQMTFKTKECDSKLRRLVLEEFAPADVETDARCATDHL